MIRDPRANEEDSNQYVVMREHAYKKTGDKFYAGIKCEDIKPDFHYQVGATPVKIED